MFIICLDYVLRKSTDLINSSNNLSNNTYRCSLKEFKKVMFYFIWLDFDEEVSFF